MVWCINVKFASGRYDLQINRYTEAEAKTIYNHIKSTGRCNGFKISSVEIFTFRGSNRA